MTNPLIVDTNALIDLFNGDRMVAERLARAGRVWVPSVVCGEVDAGTQGDTRREMRVREAFEKFLSLPRVEVLSVTRPTGRHYATVFNFCRANGRPIPTNDLWIAAAAMETGAVVLTGDAHLRRLPLIRTEFI